MRQGIAKLGLKQQELAEQLGVAPETISRWVNGALIQSRAMDNLLRLYFDSKEVRSLLRQRFAADPPPSANRVFPHGTKRENYAGREFSLWN